MIGPLGLQVPGCCEVFERADVVNLDVARLLADLAGVRQEPCDEFLVRIVGPGRLTVIDRRRFLPVEWNATEPCDQRQDPHGDRRDRGDRLDADPLSVRAVYDEQTSQ